MRYQTPRILTVLVLIGTIVASLLVYPALPSVMATHWNITGQVDGTMPKLYGAFFLPTILLFITGGFYVIPYIDPRRQNIEGFRGAYEWFIPGILAFLAYVHGLVLLVNLGVQIDVGRALVLPIAALFYGLGILLEHAKSNWFIGIRTPWTLSDDEVWDETHSRGAWAYKLAAIISLGSLLFPRYYLMFILVPVLAATAYTLIFSYVAYRRKHRSSL